MWKQAMLLVLVAGGCAGPADAPVKARPDPEVAVAAPDAAVEATRPAEPAPPTLRLPTTFAAIRYRARLAIDPAQPTFTGTIAIDGTLAEAAELIWLSADRLEIVAARAEIAGRSVALAAQVQPTDFVALRAAESLPAGAVTLHVEYRGTLDTIDSFGAFTQQVEGVPYVLTQMEPLGARRVFPCIDEPSSKVPWQLTLDVPAGQVAISNAPVEREEALDDGQHRVVFAETPPLPSYLVAFAVGPFELVDAGTTPGGAPIRIAAFRGQKARATFAAKSTARVLKILEDWFGTPYPYAKLDVVPIPSTTWFGAMENAGMITYRADLMLMDPKTATEDQKRGYVWTMAHEAAHQWFGDLVTMTWWDDLWLNEAFASWMEDKVMSIYQKTWIEPASLVRSRSWALSVDGLVSARMVRQPIAVRSDIDSAFDGITYQKGAAVIRMFEAWVGADDFRAGVQAYLKRHAWGTATSDDFLAAIDDASPLDVAPAFRTLIEQAGAPRVSAELVCSEGAAPKVTLRQDRWLPRGSVAPAGAPPRWQLPVCVAYGSGKGRSQACTLLTEETGEVALTGNCPAWFLPNAGGLGYYRMGLARDAIDALLSVGWKRLHPEERVLVANDVDAMVERGDLPLGASLDLVPRQLGDGTRDGDSLAAGTIWGAQQVASDSARLRLAAWVRKTMAARARKLGWLPGKKPDLDAERARSALLPLVATIGRDPRLLDQAVKLAKKWRKLPEGSRGLVLHAAVLRSPEVAAELLAELPVNPDVQVRRDLISALTAIDDPERAKQALEVLLDPRLDLNESIWLLNGLAGWRAVQPVAEAFLRDHFDELVPRIPPTTVAYLVYTLTASCDASKRADAEAWATEHLVPQVGGPRTVAQALEGMDLCIARKAALGPELDAWLETR